MKPFKEIIILSLVILGGIAASIGVATDVFGKEDTDKAHHILRGQIEDHVEDHVEKHLDPVKELVEITAQMMTLQEERDRKIQEVVDRLRKTEAKLQAFENVYLVEGSNADVELARLRVEVEKIKRGL